MKSTNARSIALGAKFSRREAERLRLLSKESGMTVSTLLHKLVIQGRVHPRPLIHPVAIEQWRALAPLAANLNQIARQLNERRYVDPDALDACLRAKALLGEIRASLIRDGRGI